MNYAMRMLANRHTRRLFEAVAGAVALFTLAAAAAAAWGRPHAAALVVAAGACLGLVLLGGLYLYFRKQEQILEQAVAQVQAYLGGNTDARLPCEEEGELYRLFQEVNSLAAILNAHAEQESAARVFLKDTLSNISHQLKTPLAALNIYNGLLQQEAGDQPVLRDLAARTRQYGAMRAVGMAAAQVRRMIFAEAATYTVLGFLVGCGLGLPLHAFLYNQMITHYWGVAWQLPLGTIGGIVALLVFTSLAAPFAPARRVCSLPVAGSINEL